MNLLKAGGWMKYKKYFEKYFISRKKSGFTLIESLAYIFLTSMILVEGINLYVLMYKSYIQSADVNVKYNNCQNFYINLDNIIDEGGLEEIVLDDKYILFLKDSKVLLSDTLIKSNEGKIFVKYSKNNITKTIKPILKDIDYLQVKKKGKLIYLIICDVEGKEFIRCI